MMGKRIRYTDEFKQEAVNQVVVHGYPVSEVSQRLGISTKSLYVWIKKFSKPRQQRENESDLRAEDARLKRELGRSWLFHAVPPGRYARNTRNGLALQESPAYGKLSTREKRKAYSGEFPGIGGETLDSQGSNEPD